MIETITGRIEEQNSECIINSTNADLGWEETTINGDILRKAGPELLKDFKHRFETYGKLNVGDLFVTPGYNCPAKLICHVYSPWYGMKNYLESLKELYFNIFYRLGTIGIKEVGIPLLGTGAFMIPKKESLDCLKLAAKSNHQIEKIKIVLLNGEK